MAKYKAYPEYKESGVEWFDVRPLGWKITRLKLETFLNMGQSPSSDDCNIEGDGLAFLQGNAEFGKVNPIEKQYCPVPKKIANPGDILFSVRAPVGAMNFADKKYGIGRGLCSIAASAKLTSPFLWWLLPTYKYQLDAIATGSTFEAVSAEQLGNLCFALPSISEQSQIAVFLDHETAKIDNLIEKQHQLIELLKEKRQAVISHAVTKGLNPDVPMKDSGVEWLGEVPEHWVLSKAKYYCTIKGRIGFRGYTVQDLVDENEGALVLGASEMRSDGSIVLNSPQYISWGKYYESPEIMLDKNMILFVQRGSTVGKVSFITHDLGKATINPSLIVLRDLNICGEFMSCSLMSSFIQNTVKMQTSSTAIPMISQEQVGNYFQLIPPLNEQLKIAEYIASNVSKIDQAINTAEISISLIKERRTALISAAVTGKIDVRDWVAPDTRDIEEPQEATA
ncbi:restriction endonuclease [Enterobacterales bacterium CwR94]|nr:restriction endonuclease [Enterobacterales bacterium CwR94]